MTERTHDPRRPCFLILGGSLDYLSWGLKTSPTGWPTEKVGSKDLTSKNVFVLHQNEGGIGKSTQDFLRPEGNLKGQGDGFPNTSLVLVEYGHSHISIFLQGGSGSGNPSLDRDGLTVLKSTLLCWWWENVNQVTVKLREECVCVRSCWQDSCSDEACLMLLKWVPEVELKSRTRRRLVEEPFLPTGPTVDNGGYE